MNGAGSFVLRDANVLDEAGSFSGPLDVHVENGRVVAVGSGLRADDGPSVDFSELFLLPGIFDCHDHVSFSTVAVGELLQIPVTQWALEAAQNARLTLEAGVTVVRDLCGADRGLRDAIDRGFVRVARLGSRRPPAVLAQVVVEHEEIVDALEHRDPETALSALVEHLHKSDYAIAERQRKREKVRQ